MNERVLGGGEEDIAIGYVRRHRLKECWRIAIKVWLYKKKVKTRTRTEVVTNHVGDHTSSHLGL